MQEKEQLNAILIKLNRVQSNLPDAFVEAKTTVKNALERLTAAEMCDFGCVRLHKDAASIIKKMQGALNDLDYATNSTLHQDEAAANAAASKLFGEVYILTKDPDQEKKQGASPRSDEKIDGETITKWTNLIAPFLSIVLGILFACHAIPNFFGVDNDTLYYLLGELVSFAVSFVAILIAHLINKYGRKGYYEAIREKYPETGVKGFIQRNFRIGNTLNVTKNKIVDKGKSGERINIIGGTFIEGGDDDAKQECTINATKNKIVNKGKKQNGSINIIGGTYVKRK